MTDLTNVKPGTALLVRVVMQGNSVDGGHFHATSLRHSHYFDPADVVSIEPAPLAIGDTVTWGKRALNYKIRSIVDGHATLEAQGMPLAVWPVSDLERVEPVPLQVGDKVEWPTAYSNGLHLHDAGTGTIDSIRDGTAAVWTGSAFVILPLSALERVP